MDDYYNELYSKIEEQDGLVVERIPTYWNNQCVDEEINVKFNIDLIKKYKVKLIKKFNMKI